MEDNSEDFEDNGMQDINVPSSLHALRYEHILNFQAMTETSDTKQAARYLEEVDWDITVSSSLILLGSLQEVF